MSKRIRSERGHLARIERAARMDRKGLSDSGVRFFFAVVIAAALVIATFEPSTGSYSSAQSLRLCGECPGFADAQQTAARNAALIAATQDLLKQTSEIRQLSILRPVQSSAQSRAEIERALIKSLDEDTTPAEIHANEITLKKLGLAPMDFQYRALMLRVLTEQVAGYYDPKTRQFHLADWIDLDGQKPIMAHELTHALQDQHFNLRRFEHWPKGDSDAELAAHALIEGDATLAMALYVANNPLVALAFLKSLGASGMASEELDKAPRALRESLLFPYQDGEKWVNALYKRGGWNEVSQAFTTLPQSTEQILHPEKYFAHEAPVKVALPDIASLLNRSERPADRGPRAGSPRGVVDAGAPSTRKSVPLPIAAGLAGGSRTQPGWKKLDSDVQGEWGFYLILDQFLKSPGESRRAAAGWGGDRFAVYEGPKGKALIASLSVWDTENDAREFFDAYVKRTKLRYPEAAYLPDPGLMRVLETGGGEVIIEIRGTRVLIVDGIPDRVDERPLLKALWS